MNVFGVDRERLRAVGIIRRSEEIAACAYDFVLRKRDIHVERAEIGKEFRGVVELMAIPRAFPPHANFRKPLADHVKIAQVSSSRDNFGHLVAEGDLEFHFRACRDGSGKFDLHHRVIGCVVVVSLDEAHFVGQVTHAGDFEMRDSDFPEMLGLPFEVGIVAALFSHKSGLGLEAIQIQVKRKCFPGLAGEIFVAQGFCCSDRMLYCIECDNFINNTR